MITVIIIAGIFFVATYLYLTLSCFFTQTSFIKAYKIEYRKSRVSERAIEAALRVFTHRSPFDQLSNTDIKEFSRVFGILADPMTAAALVRSADRRRNLQRRVRKFHRGATRPYG